MLNCKNLFTMVALVLTVGFGSQLIMTRAAAADATDSDSMAGLGMAGALARGHYVVGVMESIEEPRCDVVDGNRFCTGLFKITELLASKVPEGEVPNSAKDLRFFMGTDPRSLQHPGAAEPLIVVAEPLPDHDGVYGMGFAETATPEGITKFKRLLSSMSKEN